MTGCLMFELEVLFFRQKPKLLKSCYVLMITFANVPRARVLNLMEWGPLDSHKYRSLVVYLSTCVVTLAEAEAAQAKLGRPHVPT